MSTTRPRRTFVADTREEPSVPEEEDSLLDEQQQDDVVQKLTEQNQRSNARWISILKIFILCGGIVNLIGLVILIRATAAGTEPILFADQPIPLAPAFAFLSLVLTGISYNITGHPHSATSFGHIPHEYLTIASLAPPALSFFLGKHRSQTFWWFSETALIGVCATAHSMIVSSEGEKGPEGLNKLKYENKGA
ncbi:hypothetical protein DACRYDRAFT_106226 [Dacryopinax primogenitus]|uniref:Uncharacterized protein n=1 Tax=Dacryopinax primogenitus (strain DJM 731) TaxID=1858805 RepID=M5GE77_DACPD|nr:uncharacterized protein DACRYDRAFT_106226 [Dacryopinax primogenitus]EJU03048.1 hypothetical protein DACRYDRAFT_106226 [Dacryopinax primogenitus]